MDEIINNYNITLAECLNHYQNCDKGMIRSTMGAMVENWVNGIFNNINSQYENRGEIRKGESDRIPITNSFGTTIGMQVDRHIYVDNKLKAVIECKAYLDRSMMIRANDDIGRIKKYKSDVKGYILVLENAVSAIAEKFILEEGILDNVFYLTHGKRSPVKQIWLPENHKALNVGVLESFYNTIQSLYEN
jgi:hypothetical protein